MNTSPSTSSHQEELRVFGHQNARFAFHHESFMDSLSLKTTRTQAVAALTVFLFLTLACVLVSLVYMVILIENHNFHAASWAFLTGVVAAGTSTLFILHLLTRLEHWHDRKTLEGIKIFGLIMSIISGLATGVYIVLGFLEQSKFSLEGENYFSSTIFCGLCLGMSLFLYFTSQWYQNAIQLVDATRAVDMQNIIVPALEATA